jgi:hypothetical protein
MNVSSLTPYNSCYNCNTSSWRAGYQYVSMKVTFSRVSDNNKKIKVSLNLTNNVGTYLMASDSSAYKRKICFTKKRKFSEATCVSGTEIEIKGKNDAWTNGSTPSANVPIPQEAGEYALKIFSSDCNTSCNPYATGCGAACGCEGYYCAGIATFQTDYVIKVN